MFTDFRQIICYFLVLRKQFIYIFLLIFNGLIGPYLKYSHALQFKLLRVSKDDQVAS